GVEHGARQHASEGLARAQALARRHRAGPHRAPFQIARKRRETRMNAGLYGKTCAMPAPHCAPVPTLAEAAQWAPEQIVGLAQANVALQRDMDAMRLEFAALKHQPEWFRRQLFGQKSEKRVVSPDPAQMHLGELPIPDTQPDVPGKTVAGHTRRASRTDFAQSKDESALFFDE